METKFLLYLSISIFVVGMAAGFYLSNAFQNQLNVLIGAAIVLAFLTWLGSGADFIGLIRQWYREKKEAEKTPVFAAIELGEQYKNVAINGYTLYSVGIDTGFGSSRTAIVVTELLQEEHKIRIIHSQEWEHANPQDIVDLCFNLYRKHWNTWFWIDGANRAFVNLMKVAWNEPLSWETSKQGPNPEVMKVLPVNFATEHKQMLAHLHMLINKEYLAIPNEFDRLIISLRTAYAKEYSLDKEQTSYSDSLDALRLACKMFKMN